MKRGSSQRTGSRFGFSRASPADQAETAWSFQLPRPDFVAGSYAGRTFLHPANHLGEDSAHLHHDPVHAIANGIVRLSGRATGYGRVVVIEHRLPDGSHVTSIYGHLCGHTGYPLIPKGSSVAGGEVIGYIGDVDENGDGREHLHLGIRKGAYDGNYCGYARQPQCTARHYESPTQFIERRAGRMEFVAGLTLSNATPLVLGTASFDATVRNDFHYGGKFEFRIRFETGSGTPFVSLVVSRRLAPGAQGELAFQQDFAQPGQHLAVLEMKAPGTSTWSAVEPSAAEVNPRAFTVASGGGVASKA